MESQRGAVAILALIILIMGALVILTNQKDFLFNMQQIRSNQEYAKLEHASVALQGWNLLHGSLPCPDMDEDGWLDKACNQKTTEGWLPWKKLNLLSLRKNRIYYTLEKHRQHQTFTLRSPDFPQTWKMDIPYAKR